MITKQLKNLGFMAAIENKEQYDWAVNRVEQLLPLVNDDTPKNDPNSIELELLSNMVADYSDKHYAIGEPATKKVSKTLEAARKLKGSIIVNDPVLYIH